LVSINEKFKGKLALVTGGSSGIGLATAKLLSARGANVWIMARNQERLQSALAQIRDARLSPDQSCGAAAADVTDLDAVKSAAGEIERENGGIDILIASAGDVYPGLFQETDVEIIRSAMEVNYFGMVNVIHACLPGMLERRSGHIVNIASVYGFLSNYGYSAYCASKFAIRGFSDALKLELKSQGIDVSIVFPQNTATPQLEREEQLKSQIMKDLDNTRVMPAEDVAKAIVRGIARRQYQIIPGIEGQFLYRLNSFFGGGTRRLMERMVCRAHRRIEKG